MPNGENQNLYRIVSRKELDSQDLNKLFEGLEVVKYVKHSFAYPDMADSRNYKLPEFILDKGLYYPNAMEVLASD